MNSASFAPGQSLANASAQPRNPVAHNEVLSELGRLAESSLAQQACDTRLEIIIDGLSTFWRRPVSAVVPAFLVRSRGGTPHLQLWHVGDRALLQFVRGPESRWILDSRITEAAAIIQELPASAFVRPEGDPIATPAQVETLRRLLQLPAHYPLPGLHRLAATRLLDRLLLEPALVRLRAEHIDVRPAVVGE